MSDTDDVNTNPERLINLSLCKMQESRIIRKSLGGGSTLHKQLLISTVLTRARTIYFEKWYMKDNNNENISSSLSMDDDGSEEHEEHNGDSEQQQKSKTSLFPSSSTSSSTLLPNPQDEEQTSINNNHIVIEDPLFYVETGTENEIELPSDILNCVEKLNQEDDSFNSLNSIHNQSASQVLAFDEVDMQTENSSTSSSTTGTTSTVLTYLDLDSISSSNLNSINTINSTSNIVNSSLEIRDSLVQQQQEPEKISIAPLILPSLNNITTSNNSIGSSKRKHWSFDDDDDDEIDEDLTRKTLLSSEINEKLKRNGISVTNVINVAKRFRISSNNNDEDEVDNSTTTKLLNVLNGDDEPFLLHALDQTNWYNEKQQINNNNNDETTSTSSKKNRDRRVPSSGSSSSSDGDEDAEMEVDQITSLVQYCSLKGSSSNHQQQQQQKLSSPKKEKNSSTTTLVRSISSPDLCNRPLNDNFVTNPSKDLFGNHCHHQRVLTMTV